MSGSTLRRVLGLMSVVLVLTGCEMLSRPASTSTPVPSATPYPTYTPISTSTPYPTCTPASTPTPYPTYTTIPTPTPVVVGEWVGGHFWSIQVSKVQVKTKLDGIHPTNGVFVLVEVKWKANNLTEMHIISGNDFELVDDAGKQHRIVGMIYEPETFAPYSANARFQKGKWQFTRARGNAKKTYRLVFDLPASVAGLKLWFRDLPMIDLGAELP